MRAYIWGLQAGQPVRRSTSFQTMYQHCLVMDNSQASVPGPAPTSACAALGLGSGVFVITMPGLLFQLHSCFPYICTTAFSW